MRILWEIFTVVIAVGVLFAIGKGFKGFGTVLRAILLNPIGLIGVAALVFWIIMLRNKAAAQKAAGHDKR